MRERKHQPKDFFGDEKSETMMSVLHSPVVYGMRNEIDENMMEFSSFSWEEFTGNFGLYC